VGGAVRAGDRGRLETAVEPVGRRMAKRVRPPRARHYALWLVFITQFFRDFDSEQGWAMLANHAIALCLRNERRDLEYARDSLSLSDTDITETIALPSQKGAYSTLYMISARGRGAVRIAPGDPE
jgi:hypothetical protein